MLKKSILEVGHQLIKNKEFKALIDNLKNRFDFSKIGDISIEIDPRRVDEKLLFYNSCSVNRLSFGIQEFDLDVQKRINRIQPQINA